MRDHLKSAAVFLFLILFLVVFFVWIARGAEPDDHVAPAYIKALHKHHGIEATMQYRGEHYFYRNGMKVKI
ncbi:MAG: hypothetical protein ABSG90_12845 [Dehalococcoidia bacterium]